MITTFAIAFLSSIVAIFLKPAKYMKVMPIFPILALLSIAFMHNTSWDIGTSPQMHFMSDNYSWVFALILMLLWLISTVYSLAYMRENNNESTKLFIVCQNIAIFLSLGAIFSADLITNFIFYELLSIASIPLMMHFCKKESVKRYIILLFLPSIILLLPAILFIKINLAQTTYMPNGLIQHIVSNPKLIEGITFDSTIYGIVFVCLIFGVAKSLLFPMYTWILNTSSAPAPVSALIHAVVIVNIGIFFIFRIVNNIYGIDFLSEISHFVPLFNAPYYTSLFGAILSGIFAIFQRDIKKILIHSTVSQSCLALMMFFFYSKIGIISGFLQMTSHAMTKILLFFFAGICYSYAKSNSIIGIKSLCRSHKILAIIYIFGVLSTVGIPFSLGFIAKSMATISAHVAKFDLAMYTIILCSILSTIYFIKPTVFLFYTPNRKRHASGTIKIMILTCVFIVGLNLSLTFVGFYHFFDYQNLERLINPIQEGEVLI